MLNQPRTRAPHRLTVLAASLLAACTDSAFEPVDTSHILTGSGFTLEVDADSGTFDVRREDGSAILTRVFGEVGVNDPETGREKRYLTSEDYRCVFSRQTGFDDLGSFARLEGDCAGQQGAPSLGWQIGLYPEQGFIAVSLTATAKEALTLGRLVPAKIDARQEGALRIGAHPADHRVLEAGSSMAFDFFVDLLPGDTEQSIEAALGGIFTGYQEGHSVSNWNHSIKDLSSGRGFVAGSLDFEFASPMFNLSYEPGRANDEDGRTSFTFWAAEFPYLPEGKPLTAGQRITAGPIVILPDTDDLFVALETYAGAVKAHNQIRLWPERGPNNRVPTGWNSWTGSTSSGGYGATIDEALMLDNLAAMATEFRDFGGEWFQIDDGYEYFYGDWDWRPDRFPSGSAGLAAEIEATGLLPGVWIAALQVDANSQTYADHVADDWFPRGIPGLSGDKPILDPTHPEVQAWLTDRFRRIRADGYRWVKTDFSYWALGAERFYDRTATREEAYRRGLTAIRAGMDAGALEVGGEAGDTFWVNVAMIGPHTGFVDGMRPNLDTMPAWDEEEASAGRKSAQGFKPTVRTIARRYYLQNRLWIFNHDMLFFRSHADTSVPPITRDEARCLVSVVALSGSVAKLGERIVEMEPDWIEDYRTMLPVYGHGARPLDLFEREYPEVWHLPVAPAAGLNTGGRGPAYDVVAFFNWGSNDDLTTNPYTAITDEARGLGVELNAIGLDPAKTYLAREFWTGELLDDVQGSLARNLAPHTVELFALRERLDRPQYVGGNRHLLQGAVEVRGIEWDAPTNSLRLGYDAAPGSPQVPFVHELAFYLPESWSLETTNVPDAVGVETERDGAQLRLRFSVTRRRELAIELTFSSS